VEERHHERVAIDWRQLRERARRKGEGGRAGKEEEAEEEEKKGDGRGRVEPAMWKDG